MSKVFPKRPGEDGYRDSKDVTLSLILDTLRVIMILLAALVGLELAK